MPEVTSPIEIPKRALFKAAEVCDIVKVQPYVLRTWEAEFPELGVTKTAGSPRVYRREDVEQVVRIKHLLLVEGLTLAGARRKLDEEGTPVAADVAVIDELIGRNTRERLTEVKRGLRSILDLLAGRAGGAEFHLTPLVAAAPARRGSPAQASSSRPAAHGKTSKGKAATSSRVAARRKR